MHEIMLCDSTTILIRIGRDIGQHPESLLSGCFLAICQDSLYLIEELEFLNVLGAELIIDGKQISKEADTILDILHRELL
jgi:hypothetical protein